MKSAMPKKSKIRPLPPSGGVKVPAAPRSSRLKAPKAESGGPVGAVKTGAEPRVRNRAASRGSAKAQSLTSRIEAYNRHRESYNPLRGLTLARAVSLLEDYNRGAMADLQWAYFHIEQSDPDLLALVELGLSRLAEMDWDIVASETADEALAKEQSAYVREQFDRIAGLEEAVEHLAMARFRGFAHCEIVRDVTGAIVELAPVDQWNAVRDGLKGGWRYNPEARSTTYDGLPAELDMPEDRFLTRTVARHVNRIALIKFIRANLSDKDWDAFIEIYGIPSGVVFGPPNVPQGKEAEYEASALAIAEGGSGYMPNGSSYVQNKAEAGGTPFKDRLDHLSEKLVLAGTGGKLTMLTDATGLGSGASAAHSAVFDSIASAEAGRISRIITRTLVEPMIAARFPGRLSVVYFRLAANEETDSSAIIDDVAKLHGAGFDLDEREVSERTGWKVTRRAEPAANAQFPMTNAQWSLANRAARSLAEMMIRNRAAAALPEAKDAEFREASLEQLAAATRADQAALLERLAEIDAIADPDSPEWESAVRDLDADFPGLFAGILSPAATAEAYEKINGAALASGLAEASAMRPAPTQPKTK